MNNNDGIDDYFNEQLDKGNVREKPDWAERIARSRAKFYQEGMSHGAELERDRIVKLLVKSGWLYNEADELIRGDQE
jgi:hypothetical protein